MGPYRLAYENAMPLRAIAVTYAIWRNCTGNIPGGVPEYIMGI
ncbi:hypothetical protein GXY_04879 [Novacetimonas hansenii ATCC 23769]|uniref:Uncharacterized protein n=1 Tax=Novacetimonas hansenii ATCC 23769 TaxID=714995 RepID=D5QCX0_NOVHA|nr:hypothetical protein GXY_04879 [Novacetimonas hansenii ATCC 23769]